MDQELIRIIITVIGIIWTIFKATKFYKDNKENTYLLAIECVAAGVLSALDAFRYKQEGGKLPKILSKKDKMEIMEMARKESREIGNKKGISIVNILGDKSFIDLYIEKELKRLT